MRYFDEYLSDPAYDESRQLALYVKKLNTSEKSIRDGVLHLKQWIEMQPHLPKISDETLLTRVLLLCKNRLEEAKTHIETYYILRARLVNIYKDRDPCQSEFRRCISIGTVIPMPRPTPEGFIIAIMKISPHKAIDVPSAEMGMKVYSALQDLAYQVSVPQRVILIYDYQNVSPVLLQMWFSSLKYGREILKTRLYGIEKIYFLNLSPAVNSFLQFFNSVGFMKNKLVDRIVYWNNRPSDLVEVIPKECLPSDYGGELKSMEELQGKYYQWICEKKEYIHCRGNTVADLSKLPENRKLNAGVPLDVVDGAFRQINVD